MPRALKIIGMDGIGDCIYQRPFVRMQSKRFDVSLRTAWPELYDDLPIKFIASHTPLRTQRKNVERQVFTRWTRNQPSARTVQIRYGAADLAVRGIVESLALQYPRVSDAYIMDLPDFGPCPITHRKPIALLRPTTLRKEWLNPARSPLPEYIQETVAILQSRGYMVVSVADVDYKDEWFDGPEPTGVDVKFHRGELGISSLMALVQHSAVIVGGVGWIVPAAVAAGKPLFVIFGGRGKHNGPDKIFDARMDTRKVGWAMPDNFCMCSEAEHDCDKTIANFAGVFERWLGCLDLASRAGDGLLSSGQELAAL